MKGHSRIRFAASVSGALAWFIIGAPALAQDELEDEGDEIVVQGFKNQQTSSAMKGDVPVRDIPLTIASYSEEFIDDVEAAEIADLYNYMVGVQRAGPSGYDIAIRGFQSGNADRNSILVDGLPGLTTTRGSPPSVNVASIEVVKGPASVLYGQVQPGGFVNIITKKPERVTAIEARVRSQTFVSGDTSLGDTIGFSGAVDLTGPLNESGSLAYRVIGEYRDQPSFYDGSFARSLYVTPSFSADLGVATTLLLQGEYIDSTANLYDGLVAFEKDFRNIADRTTRYSEPEDVTNEKGYGGTITLDHEFSDRVRWHTAFRAVHHQDDSTGLRNRSFVDAQTLRRQERVQDNVREYFFVDTNLSLNFNVGGIQNKVLIGVNGGRGTTDFHRIRLDNGNATTNIDVYDPVYDGFVPRTNNNPNRAATTQDTIGIYLQDQLAFTERFKAVAAVRYEAFKIEGENLLDPAAPHEFSEGDRISPMVGLIFQPNQNWSIYTSYATSFNPPRAGAVDVNGDTINDPELGKQIEAGVKYSILGGRINATGSIFRIEKRNVTESLGNNVFALIGAEESKGVEFEFDAQVMPTWNVIASYSYIKATVTSDVDLLNVGQLLTNVPLHTASVFSRYNIPAGPLAGLGFSLGVSYTGQRFGTLPKGLSPRLELPGYVVADVGVFYEMEHVTLSLLANNLLDEHYFQSASSEFRVQPGTPRSLILSARTRF
jgi:iron complex outermembrane receptor protein